MGVNVADGSVEYDFLLEATSFNMFQLSRDHSLLALTLSDNSIGIVNTKTGKIENRLVGHTEMANKMAFSDDNRRFMSGSLDGHRKLWNLETGKEMVSLISTSEHDYAIVTPDQYYYTTKGASQSIHFVKGTEIYPFEQFDLKYNRPDIILERLEANNQELIKPFNLAYKKRLKRLGFTEDMLSGEFHLPKVIIANKDGLPVHTEKSKIELALEASDTKFKLNRVLIRVNGVPVNGKMGFDISSDNANEYNKNLSIELSSGLNTITAAVMNEKGVESIVDQMEIRYNPAKVQLPTLHLVTLGVSKYEQTGFDLKYAAKDASDLSGLFSAEHTAFEKVKVHHLTDDKVSLDAVQQLGSVLEGSSVDDVVCVFFAGHGILDKELNYFLAAHSISFENPSEGGIPYENLEDLLDGIPARRKLMLIDACHSGEIDKEEVELAAAEEVVHDDISFRAITGTTVKQVGLNNSFELMKELFNDIRKSSGAMIISSAGGTEYAMEGDQWNNGVFTYALINGLKNKDADLNKDGRIMMSEVNRYVRAKVWELTNGQQKPTNRAEVMDQDWRIW